jgi:hypothetical protein
MVPESRSLPVEHDREQNTTVEQATKRVTEISSSRIDVDACIVSLTPIPKSEDPGTLSRDLNDHLDGGSPPPCAS